MKQFLTVTAILFCAYLTQGFNTATTPVNNQTMSSIQKAGIRHKSNKAWTNPWAAAKAFSAHVSYDWDPTPFVPTYYIRIRVNGVEVVSSTDDVFGDIYPAAGSTITFESSVASWHTCSVHIEDRTDWDVYETLYYTNGGLTTVSYSWTAVEGHSYNIWFYGH